jgi:hypothetical protein
VRNKNNKAFQSQASLGRGRHELIAMNRRKKFILYYQIRAAFALVTALFVHFLN